MKEQVELLSFFKKLVPSYFSEVSIRMFYVCIHVSVFSSFQKQSCSKYASVPCASMNEVTKSFLLWACTNPLHSFSHLQSFL